MPSGLGPNNITNMITTNLDNLNDNRRNVATENNSCLQSNFNENTLVGKAPEFEDTVTLMEEVKYNTAYLFPYSMREKTTAHRRYKDNVPEKIKMQRLNRMVEVFRKNALSLNLSQIGKSHLVLIEGFSKRSVNCLQGRNDNNIKVILPANDQVPLRNGQTSRLLKPGDYVAVHINSATSQVLKGIPLYLTGLQEYYQQNINSCSAMIG